MSLLWSLKRCFRVQFYYTIIEGYPVNTPACLLKWRLNEKARWESSLDAHTPLSAISNGQVLSNYRCVTQLESVNATNLFLISRDWRVKLTDLTAKTPMFLKSGLQARLHDRNSQNTTSQNVEESFLVSVTLTKFSTSHLHSDSKQFG